MKGVGTHFFVPENTDFIEDDDVRRNHCKLDAGASCVLRREKF